MHLHSIEVALQGGPVPPRFISIKWGGTSAPPEFTGGYIYIYNSVMSGEVLWRVGYAGQTQWLIDNMSCTSLYQTPPLSQNIWRHVSNLATATPDLLLKTSKNWGSPPSSHCQTSSSLGTKFLALISWGLWFIALIFFIRSPLRGCSRMDATEFVLNGR